MTLPPPLNKRNAGSGVIMRGEEMARKRIYGDGPLTPAEKQQRYRNRTKKDIADATKKIVAKEGEELRENLHRYINGLSYVELFDLAQAIINPGPKQYGTLEELSALSGIPEHELKSLERKGVISKEKPEDVNPFLPYAGYFED